MKKLTKISLGKLYQDDMATREMNMLRGGNNCGCNCDGLGSAATENLYSCAWATNSIDDGSHRCSWEGSGGVTVYGGSTVPA